MSPYIRKELTLIAMTKALDSCLSLQVPRYRMEAYLKADISLDDVERHDTEAVRRAVIHRDLMQIGRHERPMIDALERDLSVRRRRHQSTRATLAQMRAVRITQLQREISHG